MGSHSESVLAVVCTYDNRSCADVSLRPLVDIRERDWCTLPAQCLHHRRRSRPGMVRPSLQAHAQHQKYDLSDIVTSSPSRNLCLICKRNRISAKEPNWAFHEAKKRWGLLESESRLVSHGQSRPALWYLITSSTMVSTAC